MITLFFPENLNLNPVTVDITPPAIGTLVFPRQLKLMSDKDEYRKIFMVTRVSLGVNIFNDSPADKNVGRYDVHLRVVSNEEYREITKND